MSSTELVILGTIAIVAVAGILALLTWAAILDGRYNDEQQRRERARRVRLPTATLLDRAE